MRVRPEPIGTFVTGGESGEEDLSTAVVVDMDSGWITNTGPAPVAVRAAGVVMAVEHVGPLRIFSNGYQSWSPTGVLTLGVDRDPSTAADSFELFCAAHHADQRRARPDELRSEGVCVLADDTDRILLAGWNGGHLHDGTFRVRPSGVGPSGGSAELVVEAFLGGAVLAAGERRPLHRWSASEGGAGDHHRLLSGWAAQVGDAAAARRIAPYQVGWCTWYHYFSEIDEAALDANLARSGDWPFEVFQLDDGYQTHIGDWLGTNESFPSDLPSLAERIARAGRRPGIWIAPFLAHPHSELHTTHPDWIARMPHDADQPLPGMINEIWDGVVNVVDTSNPAVLEHLENVAASLVDAGFTYLKLDFTYAPSFEGRYHDPSLTPAQRVRAGYDAIRRGAGDDAFILGCGAPLMACVGSVDGMRIGPDVAPSWEVESHHWHPSGYRETAPATRNAWQSTLARSFMHRNLWINDPDCLMLRSDATDLAPGAAHGWAMAVAASGGMALVSDDLALLGADAARLLEEVVEVGREVDGIALGGEPPECHDLLDRRPPAGLRAGAYALSGDPGLGTATLRRP